MRVILHESYCGNGELGLRNLITFRIVIFSSGGKCTYVLLGSMYGWNIDWKGGSRRYIEI